MNNGVVQIKNENNIRDSIKLEKEYRSIKDCIMWEIDNMIRTVGFGNIADSEYLKKISKYIKKVKLEHSSCFMPYLKRKDDVIEAYIMNKIKPDEENG